MNRDLDFEKAYLLAEGSYTQNELIEFLKDGDIKERQIAALKLDNLRNKSDADALIGNLTGYDGKIREAVAQKIYSFISEGWKEFFNEPEIFAKATIDINGNICRHVVDCAKLLKSEPDFASKYTEKILQYTNEAFTELNKFIFRDKKYVINKQIFKLYWCLETLQNFYDILDENILRDILVKASSLGEYTIREKAARIAAVSNKFPDIAAKLKNDDNYYVRAVFKSS